MSKLRLPSRRNAFMRLAFLLLLATLAPWAAERAAAQGNLPDTCLTLNWKGFSSNPDSILVDTCLTTRAHPVFWVKGRYELTFDSNAIPLGYGNPDSDLEVGWQAIDTAFPQIRNGFKTIADSIGPFRLKKIEPNDTGVNDVNAHSFYLIFQNYVSNDSVTARLDSIPGLSFSLIVHPIPTNAVKNKSISEISIFPNPAEQELHIFLGKGESVDTVTIMDILGRTIRVYSMPTGTELITLDVSDLPSGCYLARFGTLERLFVHQ